MATPIRLAAARWPRRPNARWARNRNTPLASSIPVLKAVVATGRRGWSGGGHSPGPVVCRTMMKAEMKPANSMTSTNTTIAMPTTPFSITRPPRASVFSACSVLRGSMTRIARGTVMADGQLGVESCVLLPVAALVLHHVRREAREHEHHQHQRDRHEPLDDRLLDVQVHEVLGDHVGLDQGDAEGGDERHHPDAREGPGDAHGQQHDQDAPDLRIVAVRPMPGRVGRMRRGRRVGAHLAMYSRGKRKIQTMSTKCQ